MSKQRLAQVLTVAVLVVAAGIAVARKSGWKVPAATPTEVTPQGAIYAMLDAAREGNVKTYLSYFAGPMAASLEQALRESGEAGFSRYLQETNAAVKGIAIAEPQPLSGREVKARVEYVYQDRNEAQVMYLEKSGGQWRIARVDAAERVKTLVPYGTPVQ